MKSKTFSNASIHHLQTFDLLMGCKWLPKSKPGQKQRNRKAERRKEGSGPFQMEFKTLFTCRHQGWEIWPPLRTPASGAVCVCLCLVGDIMPPPSHPAPHQRWVNGVVWAADHSTQSLARQDTSIPFKTPPPPRMVPKHRIWEEQGWALTA